MAAPDAHRPRLAAKFAVAGLVAFVAIGIAVSQVMIRAARTEAEDQAQVHANFVVASVLGPALEGADLRAPLSGAALAAVDRIVRDRILPDGRTLRIKVWRDDGTVLYSDDASLIGRRFPEEAAEIEEIGGSGEVENGVSELDEAENLDERDLADKLFETYVPWRSSAGAAHVVEIYQDYSQIQAQIDTLVRTLAVVLAGGLALLYAIVLPIAVGASKALRRTNDELRERSSSLSVLLAREQETVEELRNLNQMQSDFVSAASHELRTPLTSIIGYLQALRHPDIARDPTTAEEFISSAERQATRLSLLVGKLLHTAGLTKGSSPIDVSAVDLSVLCAGVVEALAHDRSRVDVSTPDGSVVVTDVDRVHEIALNLVENALKFSPSDARVGLHAEIHGQEIVLQVSDHGSGIDPADQRAIFDRFHQVDQSLTREHGGLGLGLYITKRFVDDLDGSIEIDSALGRGTIVRVHVPQSELVSTIDAVRGQPVR
jgi:signal transduction histidine kinase